MNVMSFDCQDVVGTRVRDDEFDLDEVGKGYFCFDLYWGSVCICISIVSLVAHFVSL